MSDGSAFRVYKYDIKSFYESVSIDDLLNRLRLDVAFSGQPSRIISSLFKDLKAQSLQGLPRGIALSATLAEYLMRSFDRKISGYDGVWYYSRFVDDIIVVARPDIEPSVFDKFASECLPPGLKFNDKSKWNLFEPYVKNKKEDSKEAPEGDFDFLGYNFSVSKAYQNKDNNIIRSVKIDIAASKVRRIKTRIALSLIRFKSDGNFDMLLARFRLLTSNFTFVDKQTGRRRVSGIYYNYPLVDPSTSKSLLDLDKFVRSAVLSPHMRNKLRPALTKKDRQRLLRMTFLSGFKKRRFFNFSPKQIAELKDCWEYA